jgi:hypothetical protein
LNRVNRILIFQRTKGNSSGFEVINELRGWKGSTAPNIIYSECANCGNKYYNDDVRGYESLTDCVFCGLPINVTKEALDKIVYDYDKRRPGQKGYFYVLD